MRIGMVCPYSFDVHGGVQAHVLQLAEVMRDRGHEVSVLAPASPQVDLPDYVVSGGKAVPIPYNGSVARLRFGPSTHRLVKRWIAGGDFDVLHLHEPNAPSLSLLALMVAEGPIDELGGEPVAFPGVFLGGVGLEPVIFPVGSDQVLHVETGDAEPHGVSPSLQVLSATDGAAVTGEVRRGVCRPSRAGPA